MGADCQGISDLLLMLQQYKMKTYLVINLFSLGLQTLWLYIKKQYIDTSMTRPA